MTGPTQNVWKMIIDKGKMREESECLEDDEGEMREELWKGSN